MMNPELKKTARIFTDSLSRDMEATKAEIGGRGGRKKGAILIAEPVDMPRRIEELGELEALKNLASNHSTMRELSWEHGGTVLLKSEKTFMAFFEDSIEALTAARKVRGYLLAQGEGAIRHRIGLHVGYVFVTPDGDIKGNGAYIAMKVMHEAGPNSICTSCAFRDDVKEHAPASQSGKLLKNLSKPVSAIPMDDESGADEASEEQEAMAV